MALNIKNAEVERLVAELAAMTGESKTQVIRVALVATARWDYDLRELPGR